MGTCFYCCKPIKPGTEIVVDGKFEYCTQRCRNLDKLLTTRKGSHDRRTFPPPRPVAKRSL